MKGKLIQSINERLKAANIGVAVRQKGFALYQIRLANPQVVLIIILDNASIHKAKKVKAFCELSQIV